MTDVLWTRAALAFTALALVLLFVAPFATASKLQSLRHHQSQVTSPAQVHVNDLEAAIATMTAARSAEADSSGSPDVSDTSTAASRAAMARDLASLGALVHQLTPTAVARFDEARDAIAAWERAQDGANLPNLATPAARRRRVASVMIALVRLQALETEVDAVAERERIAIERVERYTMLAPAALVPLALLALAAVGWTAHRTRALSLAAIEGRRAAEEAMAAKAALMRGVTHDLKNPLGAARGYADLLADGSLGAVPEGQVRTVHRIRNLVDVALKTVQDLVELSRAEAGGLGVERVEVDVAALAREAVDDFRATSRARGIVLEYEDAPVNGNGRVVKSDPARVRQVLGNMLSNAVKYTPPGGTALVRVAELDDREIGRVIAIDVADDGPGVPRELRERVFEEFFRVESTKAMAPGSGVGLAIARRVARLLGGDLRLRESDGGGATFSLLLPAPRDGAGAAPARPRSR